MIDLVTNYTGGGNILNTKYRTSVLYDFSIVTKAVFYIMEQGKSFIDGANQYKIVEKLPVQINPSKLSGFAGTQHVHAWGAGVGTDTEPKKKKKHHKRRHSYGSDHDDKEEIRISLHYDLYDEYQVVTMGGTIPSELSLNNITATSMKKLVNYAGMDEFRILFRWGEIEYFGFLASVDYDYDCFSQWGEPLKGDAEITIACDSMGRQDAKNGYEPISPTNTASFATAKVQIESYTKADEIGNRAMLGLTSALR